MTTHYMDKAEELCGRISIMNEGEVVAEWYFYPIDNLPEWMKVIAYTKPNDIRSRWEILVN